MQVGDLVQIRHNEHHGMFVVLGKLGLRGGEMEWARIFSLNKSKEFVELVRSLEVVKKCP
jgi:putative heme degradation protein